MHLIYYRLKMVLKVFQQTFLMLLRHKHQMFGKMGIKTGYNRFNKDFLEIKFI